jgi:cyclohexanone monooxygenase
LILEPLPGARSATSNRTSTCRCSKSLNYIPTEKYARAPEILAHSQATGRKYDLYRNACFQTEVTELRWDEGAARWTVAIDRGDRLGARYVVMSNGPLNRPKLPGIPGLELYKGHAFHTSRWDYAYTGGDSNGDLSGLRGKRVGIIGTGATAVQCVPHLAAAARWSSSASCTSGAPAAI